MIPVLPEAVQRLFPFEARWATSAGYQLHYIDEGPRRAEAIVLLHGNPTWSFSYRDFIPAIVEAGFRVVAPDYLGFGRSDHARSEEEYAIVHHVARTLDTLDQAGVEKAVFFLHDWGGPIGLGTALARPGLMQGMVAGNTFWGVASEFHRRIFPWRTMHAPIAGPLLLGRRRLFPGGFKLSAPESVHDGPGWEAYNLPFAAHNGPGGTLAFPRAISLGPGHPTQPLADAIWEAMPAMDVPTRLVWGDADAVFPPGEQGEAMRTRLRNGASHGMTIIAGGRHFIQEYEPQTISRLLIDVATEAFS